MAFPKSVNMKKQYATRTIINSVCSMAKDYSPRINDGCYKCHYCYRYFKKTFRRKYQSQWIHNEVKYNPNLYKAPIFISRYCDPFYNDIYAKHSLYVAQSFLDNDSQVIFNTNAPSYIERNDFIQFVEHNKDNIQMQFKLFNYKTESSKRIKELLCPNIPNIDDVYNRISLFDFVDRVIVIDPLIIGVNNIDIKYIIDDMISKFNIKKIIIKQLFATSYFKNYLSESLTLKNNYLTEKVGLFYTYNNLTLLHSCSDIIEKCYKNNIDIMFCNNKEINNILNNKKYNNCCMFTKNKYIYDIDPNFIKQKLSGSSSLIKKVVDE